MPKPRRFGRDIGPGGTLPCSQDQNLLKCRMQSESIGKIEVFVPARTPHNCFRIGQNVPWSQGIWLILQVKHVQSFMIFESGQWCNIRFKTAKTSMANLHMKTLGRLPTHVVQWFRRFEEQVFHAICGYWFNSILVCNLSSKWYQVLFCSKSLVFYPISSNL